MAAWDDKRMARARKALRLSVHLHEAAQRLGDCSSAGLAAAFERRGEDPRQHLRADPSSTAALREVQDRKAQAGTVRKLQAQLTDAEDRLAWMHSAAAHPAKIATPRSRPKSGLRAADPIFMWSDLHFGERVTRAESLGTNHYDLAEADRRFSKLVDNELWLRRDMARTQTCDHTLLNINGDIVTGDIHDELRETNEGGLRSQCNFALDHMIPGIIALADATPGILHIVCMGGNHGRLTKKTHIKNGFEHSVEHIGIYDPLRRIIGDRKGKIAWHIPPAQRFLFSMHGRRISLQHGDHIRSQGGVGGVIVPMMRWVHRVNDADLYMFGHFHEADAYGKIIKNGALIGESGYTKWLGVESRPPEQVGFVIDAHAGVRRFERISVL